MIRRRDRRRVFRMVALLAHQPPVSPPAKPIVITMPIVPSVVGVR